MGPDRSQQTNGPFCHITAATIPGNPKPREGDVEARLKERNKKCSKGDGRRRRSDLTSLFTERRSMRPQQRKREAKLVYLSPETEVATPTVLHQHMHM